MTDESVRRADDLMTSFAERTGVTGERPPNRYLWTDTFAVLNLLAGGSRCDDPERIDQARTLIDQVHSNLGRHREDVEQSGWLSELDDDGARDHPTAGGLRIGKERPERPRGQPIDRRGEWSRDGQYFHYNTKWAMALDRMGRAADDATYRRWGRELMVASHDGFVYRSQPGDELRMYWKMSTDLSRPLVESMGQLDPLDGFGTCRELVSSLPPTDGDSVALDDASADFDAMLEPRDWRTSDPLGLGGVLMQAYRSFQLAERTDATAEHLDDILQGAAVGLEQYQQANRLDAPSDQRLAFREFGLALGLSLAESMSMSTFEFSEDAQTALGEIRAYDEYRDTIIDFWMESSHRESETWTEHRDINEVMLASALLGDDVLAIRSLNDHTNRGGSR
jgi:hypothetical protein